MRIVVTGAASGIGRAVCRLLSEQPLDGRPPSLVLADRDSEGLKIVESQLRTAGAQTIAVTADLSEPTAADAIVAVAISHFEALDGVVSNAGVLSDCPLAELPLAEWERVFAVNTRATWLLAKAAYPHLQSTRGAIVATCSISGTQPTPPHGAYSASKAALRMLVQQLAFEWGPQGIRVNCVSPGTVHTGLTDAVYSNKDRKDERASQIPLRRVAGPDDIASVICFLLGGAASYITGEDILVDGGLHTVLMPVVRGLSGLQ